MIVRLLAFALALLLHVQGWAAVTLVQSGCQTGAIYTETVGGNPNTGYTYTFPSAVSSGNLVVFTGMNESRSISTITGTNITYSISGLNRNQAGAGYQESQWKGVATGSVTSSQVVISGAGAPDNCICFYEFTGTQTDQSGATTNGSVNNAVTAHNSGSVTPPTADNVVVASTYISGNDATQDGAFTQLTTGNTSFFSGYILQSAATAQENNVTTVGSRYSAMSISAFAGTAGGGGGGGSTGGSLLNMFRRRVQVNP